MSLDYVVGLLVSLALLAYLVLAMMKPEKF
jgi:K+-transporting ATPase KdpF subunit